MSEKAREIVDVVIGFLQGRGGFDHWWDDIDEDVAQEICEGLAEAIDAALPIPFEVSDAGRAALGKGK